MATIILAAKPERVTSFLDLNVTPLVATNQLESNGTRILLALGKIRGVDVIKNIQI